MNTDQSQLLAGWAAADITPTGPVNLAGQFELRLARDVLDPLTLTVLALSAAAAGPGAAAVFAGADLTFIPAELGRRIRAAAAAAAPGLDPRSVILHATHTHTAPMLDDAIYPPLPPGFLTGAQYADFVVERAAEAIAAAWRARRPARAAWGLGQAVVGCNRRAVFFDDLARRPGFVHQPGTCTVRQAAMYGSTRDAAFSHFEGGADPGVQFLFTWDEQDRLSGMVVNLACPAQATENLSQVSADFWHEARLALRREHGPALFILPQCAAAGDQSPHPLWRQAAEQRMLSGRSQRQEIGRRLARAAGEILPLAAPTRRGDWPLRHRVSVADLPRRRITAAEAGLIRADLESLAASLAAEGPAADPARLAPRTVALARCRLTLRRYELQDARPALPVELHAVRLGDLAWATSPFELFHDYGVRIEARSPAQQTMTVQLAAPAEGGGWDGGYLPTARAEQGESYSANLYCNAVGAAGGEALVAATLRELQALWLGDPAGKAAT